MIKQIQYTQFVENVLGIELTLEQSCSLMEGIMPTSLSERILYESELYENFIKDIAKKIGQIPTNIQKTFNSAMDLLKFIYNVIADKTGENLKKAIIIIQRNSRALFSKVENALRNVPQKLKDVVQRVLNWLKAKVASILTVKSDVDDQDEVTADGGNWKKFILLLLSGSLLIAVYRLSNILQDFGEDAAKDGLAQMLKGTEEVMKKMISEPAQAVAATGGAAISAILMPLLKLYAGAKVLQAINDQLLDSNAWLKKT
jgi:hypothetical protein